MAAGDTILSRLAGTFKSTFRLGNYFIKDYFGVALRITDLDDNDVGLVSKSIKVTGGHPAPFAYLFGLDSSGSNAWQRNNSTSGAPDQFDDTTQYYNVGSWWIDTSTSDVYFLVDSTQDNAVWKKITGGSLSMVADSDNYTLGSTVDITSTSFTDVDSNLNFSMALNGSGVTIVVYTVIGIKTTGGYMEYRIAVDTSTAFSNPIPIDNTNGGRESVTVVGIFSNLAAGSHTFKLQCRSNDGNIARTPSGRPISWGAIEIS